VPESLVAEIKKKAEAGSVSGRVVRGLRRGECGAS
jgi:hypothetical protein